MQRDFPIVLCSLQILALRHFVDDDYVLGDVRVGAAPYLLLDAEVVFFLIFVWRLQNDINTPPNEMEPFFLLLLLVKQFGPPMHGHLLGLLNDVRCDFWWAFKQNRF